jgi:hypothetical protein
MATRQPERLGTLALSIALAKLSNNWWNGKDLILILLPAFLVWYASSSNLLDGFWKERIGAIWAIQ